MLVPRETSITDLSILSKNPTSVIYALDEREQYTGSHKYRLAYGMVKYALESGIQFDGVVEATSGNTGLALAHIMDQLNKRCVLFMNNNTEFDTLADYAEIHYSKSADEAYQDAKAFAIANNLAMLDQYNNLSAIDEFVKLGQQVNERISDINYVTMSVGTGSTIVGLSEVFGEQANIVPVTVDNPTMSVKGIKNPQTDHYGKIVLRAVQKNTFNFWHKYKISEIARARTDFTLKLETELGYSSAANLLSAVELSEKPNATIITLLCDKS